LCFFFFFSENMALVMKYCLDGNISTTVPLFLFLNQKLSAKISKEDA